MRIKLFTLLLLLAFGTFNAFSQCEFTVTASQPFVEDFEGNPFECWTVETVGAGNWTTMAGSGTTVAAFSFTNVGDEARLISPVVDLSGVNGATFSFSYAMMGFYDMDELVVSYRSSATDAWHTLGTYSISDYQNFFEETFTLSDLSSTYQVSFLGRGQGGYMIFVDNIEIMGEGGCARPVSLEATEITASSALLGWSTTGNEESWVIETNGVQKTVDVQPYLMEFLEPQTEYTFRVKANCPDGNESEWSLPITFKTLCDVIVVTDEEPYFDDFEGSDDFICWQNEILSGTDAWVVDPGYTILNNTAFFIWLGEAAMLISAPLDITAVTNPTLSFRHKQKLGLVYGTVDHLIVGYRTSEDDSWHTLMNFTEATDDWEDVTIALPDPSATYQITFEGIGHEAEGVYVDDVRVGCGTNVGLAEKTEANLTDGDAEVFDLFGRKVADTKLRSGRIDLDMNGLAPGVYVARISGENGVTTMKIVKE